MSKKFTPPTLAEITFQYLGLYKQRAREKDFESLEKQFQKALIRVQKAEEVRAALMLDTGRVLPVQMKSPMYERLLSLEGRTQALLWEYAQIMYEFGDEFRPYADQIWEEAKAMSEGQPE
jgi:hypothetical protein